MSSWEEKLKPGEWTARFRAACAIVARKYCDMFGFWRDCRFRLCRSARQCRGDQAYCIKTRWYDVPYDVAVAAHERMLAEERRQTDPFMRMTHHFPPSSGCLQVPLTKKMEAKLEAEAQAKRQASRARKSAFDRDTSGTRPTHPE